MGEVRDAARTRKKILEAARDEFAARGFAGGRIESIAKRAGVTKQLIVHHFGNKEALFEETLRSKYEQHRAALPQEDGPGAAFVQRFRAAMADPVWIRFLTWEAVEHQDTGRITAEESRRDAAARQAALIADRQARGELPADLPAPLLQLAIYALGIYPVAFPQTVEMITGRSSEDPKFQAEWTAFLAELGRRLTGK